MSKSLGLPPTLLATMICAALGGGLAPMAAVAAEADVQARIDALQKEMEALRGQVNAAAPKTAAAAVAATPAKPDTAAKALAFSNTDGVTIYGRLDLVLESSNDGQVSRTVLQNISSRIGFKGQRKLTSDLTGMFQLETGVAPDDSANSGLFASRNSYAGIKSDTVGSALIGKYDSPLKNLEGVSAPMWGSAEAMEIIIHGKGTSRAVGATWNNVHTRITNVVQYFSPTLSGIQVRLAASPDEVNGAAGTVRKPIYAGSAAFDDGMWNLGFAFERQKNFNGQDKDMSASKAVAGMALGDFSAGVAYSRLDNGLAKTTTNWMLAGTYKLGDYAFKANYGVSSETATAAADGLKMVGVEADYKLDKFTTLYAYYTKISNDAKAKGRFEAGDNKYTPAAGFDPHILGVAVRYNF